VRHMRNVAVHGTADSKAGCPTRPNGPIGWHRGGARPVAMFCAVCIVLFATDADAQCRTRDILRNQPAPRETFSATELPSPLRSAADAPAWKTIAIGTFANTFALINALDAAGCAVGDSAAEILARPAFAVSAAKTNVELVAVSGAELGFQTDVVPLAEIYARARQLGLGLAAAEVAPQLRLQYSDQPLGEFLVAMDPIETWKGEPVILTVANGGTGLVLLGRDGRADAQIPVGSRFLFVRSNDDAWAKAAGGFDEAAAFLHRNLRPIGSRGDAPNPER
jgi:hypothetical protein